MKTQRSIRSKIAERDRRIFGRTRATASENVAVYMDEEGMTRIEAWTLYDRHGCVQLSLNAARIAHEALGRYLADQKGKQNGAVQRILVVAPKTKRAA